MSYTAAKRSTAGLLSKSRQRGAAAQCGFDPMPHRRRKGPARHRPLPENTTYASKYTTTTDRQIAAYESAALHLLDAGLLPAPNVTALRSMWAAGGRSRRAAHIIATRWDMAS